MTDIAKDPTSQIVQYILVAKGHKGLEKKECTVSNIVLLMGSLITAVKLGSNMQFHAVFDHVPEILSLYWVSPKTCTF